MLRKAHLLAIPATMFVAGSAIAGPYDAYKPPAVPPMSQDAEVLRVAQAEPQVAAPTTDAIADGPIVGTSEAMQGNAVQNGEIMIGDSYQGGTVEMQDNYVPPMPAQSQGTVIVDNSTMTTVTDTTYAQPTYQQNYSQQSYQPQPQAQRPLQRLMELERRKNAWLRKTFLNR